VRVHITITVPHGPGTAVGIAVEPVRSADGRCRDILKRCRRVLGEYHPDT
jgi:hypothetical protein